MSTLNRNGSIMLAGICIVALAIIGAYVAHGVFGATLPWGQR